MKIQDKVGFAGFMIIAIFSMANGVWYSIAREIMPYHLTAIGATWESLTPGMQVMMLNFMKSAAAGFITTSVAILFLLFIPFRKEEPWSRWALLIICLTEFVNITYRTYCVKTQTPSNPPIIIPIIIILIAIASFLICFKSKKRRHING